MLNSSHPGGPPAQGPCPLSAEAPIPGPLLRAPSWAQREESRSAGLSPASSPVPLKAEDVQPHTPDLHFSLVHVRELSQHPASGATGS
ncbi:hypothetical protein J1605_002062 [Eschrichtius robustus]|uniref:Uncharacterized protein n=1 Tax=Eschrichtius robustus TaxID=9764 RepID=A0AB34I0L4_ESCRO|nr:hypothetical protein J1605_002062 [Eschrichtius robustus]